MEKAKIRPFATPKPLTDLPKNWHAWLRHGRHSANFCIDRLRGFCSPDTWFCRAFGVTSFFFHDVIRLEAVRGGSNVPIEGRFWRFLGNLNPKMLSAIMLTQKRHFLTSHRVFEPLCVKIHPRVTSVGESGENKKEKPYISRILSGAPLWPIGTIVGYVFDSWT